MPHHALHNQLSPLDHDDLARVIGGLYEGSEESYGEVASKTDIPPKTLRYAFFSCAYYGNFYYYSP